MTDRLRLQAIATVNNITLFIADPGSLVRSRAGWCRRGLKRERHDFDRVANPCRDGDVLPPGLRIGDGESGGRSGEPNLRDDRAGLLVPRPKNRCRSALASEQSVLVTSRPVPIVCIPVFGISMPWNLGLFLIDSGVPWGTIHRRSPVFKSIAVIRP